MEIVVPPIPTALTPRELANGWLGLVKVNSHEFQIRADYWPDYHSSMNVKWSGWKADQSAPQWQAPPSNATMDCWNPRFSADHRWLVGGGGAHTWDLAFERASENLVQMLMPESITRIEFSWDSPPEIKLRK